MREDDFEDFVYSDMFDFYEDNCEDIICPECLYPISQREGRCITCTNCGWSICQV